MTNRTRRTEKHERERTNFIRRMNEMMKEEGESESVEELIRSELGPVPQNAPVSNKKKDILARFKRKKVERPVLLDPVFDITQEHTCIKDFLNTEFRREGLQNDATAEYLKANPACDMDKLQLVDLMIAYAPQDNKYGIRRDLLAMVDDPSRSLDDIFNYGIEVYTHSVDADERSAYHRQLTNAINESVKAASETWKKRAEDDFIRGYQREIAARVKPVKFKTAVIGALLIGAIAAGGAIYYGASLKAAYEQKTEEQYIMLKSDFDKKIEAMQLKK